MLTAGNFFCADELVVEATERLCFAAEALSLHCRCKCMTPWADSLGLCPIDFCTCEIGEICNDVLSELSASSQHGGLTEWMRIFSESMGRWTATPAATEPPQGALPYEHAGVPLQQRGRAQAQAAGLKAPEEPATSPQTQIRDPIADTTGDQQQQHQALFIRTRAPR
ncbi:uncharacterized protein PG986_008257 [Apiospora aurea]|uniref:Extracellular membrane protein CFEM domain-containing protein n=1 Tax=Apiospora aurea TaxID=335848 RepID=A0ABR1QF54_9PEZI